MLGDLIYGLIAGALPIAMMLVIGYALRTDRHR